MRISSDLNTVKKNEAVLINTKTANKISLPVLETPYNLENPPEDVNYHFFGAGDSKAKEYGEIKSEEIQVDSGSLSQESLISMAAENGIELSEKTTIAKAIKELKKSELVIIINID